MYQHLSFVVNTKDIHVGYLSNADHFKLILHLYELCTLGTVEYVSSLLRMQSGIAEVHILSGVWFCWIRNADTE